MKIINLKNKYDKDVRLALKDKFGYRNVMAVPKIQKVIVNSGTGKFIKEEARISEIFDSITEITGQKPLRAAAKRAIAGFKLRQGQEIGVKVTLRKKRMWDFLDRLVSAALPRIRDFQGIGAKSVDDGGNLNIGIKEHSVFPEVVPEKVKNIFGLQVIVVTNAKSREEARELFKLLGFPIRDTN